MSSAVNAVCLSIPFIPSIQELFIRSHIRLSGVLFTPFLFPNCRDHAAI